jgi:hypothetical protein
LSPGPQKQKEAFPKLAGRLPYANETQKCGKELWERVAESVRGVLGVAIESGESLPGSAYFCQSARRFLAPDEIAVELPAFPLCTSQLALAVIDAPPGT